MRKQLKQIDVDAFSTRMHSESDRACAILGGALLDARLEELLRPRFSAFQRELLGADGPLGTFSSRTKIARALSLFDDVVRSDLDVVRSVRNAFAHAFDHELSFADQSISDQCRNLQTAKAFLEGISAMPISKFSEELIGAMRSNFEPPRWRFQIAVDFLSQHLHDATEAGEFRRNFLEEVRALGQMAPRA